MFSRFPAPLCVSNVMAKPLFLSLENWCHCLRLRVAFQCLGRKAARNSCLEMIQTFCVSSKTSITRLIALHELFDVFICILKNWRLAEVLPW